MQMQTMAIPDVKLITPPRFADSRGSFSETYHAAKFATLGVDAVFIQDNQSRSSKGVVRGLHCQIGPNAQGKLVRVLHGSVWDVAVDCRQGSPSYGQHVAAVLSAQNGAQLWIPAGFLHGFCALEDDVEVLYKVDAPYDRAAERGVVWNDPELALPWPLAADAVTVSDKDQDLPPFSQANGWFSL